MTLGAFTIIKNDAHWVGFCIMSTRRLVSEYVYFDGNSTDGTVELLHYIRKKYNIKIKVYENQDPADLRDDYVRVFNDCLGEVRSTYAMFLHPDMIMNSFDEDKLDFYLGGDAEPEGVLSWHVNMKSFAGEPRGKLLEFSKGRTDKWKSIMVNALGLHYFGNYGAANEDLYFKDVTGNDHVLYEDVSSYPFEVRDSGIELYHYSDVRPYSRRLGRMTTCLKNQMPSLSDERAKEIASNHPRVILEPREGFGTFEFKETEYIPEVFYQYNDEFASVCGKKPEEFCWLPLKEKVHA